MKIKGGNSSGFDPEDCVRIVTKNGFYKIQVKDGGVWKNDSSFGVSESLDDAKKSKAIIIDRVKKDWALKDNVGWNVVTE